MLGLACGGGAEATDTPTRAATATSPAASPTVTSTPLPTSTSSPTPPAGDIVSLGKFIYLNVPDNVAPQALWCDQCHTIDGISQGLIGPDHTQIGTWAATRKPGLSAEQYIRESIVDPEVFVTQGVERSTPGLMTKAITSKLTDEQVDALVDFLLTQK